VPEVQDVVRHRGVGGPHGSRRDARRRRRRDALRTDQREDGAVICPSCGEKELVNVGRRRARRRRSRSRCSCIPSGCTGEKSKDKKGQPYGGSVTDDADTSARWYEARAKTLRLLEVRGNAARGGDVPRHGRHVQHVDGNIPKKVDYACGACGTVQDVLTTVKASGKSGPVAPYAIQAYSPKRDRDGVAYGGRYFLPI
jgi:putative DNA methylase